jgi:phage recombination protein Bet
MSIAERDVVKPAASGAAQLDAVLDKQIEYMPFLSEQQISLTPRMVIRFMCKPTKSGKRATLEQALHFCMLCKARGLNPWEGDAYIVGYDTQDGPEFSLITAHQAFLKRAEVHPEYDGMRSGVIVKRGDQIVEEEGDFYLEGDSLLGGWAIVKFKSRATPVYKRLRLSVFNKGFGRWKVDPAGMIVKCSEADALRSAFPNSLGGMYLEDEMPGKSAADGLAYDRNAEASALREKTINKSADLKERLALKAGQQPIDVIPEIPAEPAVNGKPEAKTEAVDEKAEIKRLKAAIKKKYQELDWEEAKQDKFQGGKDINAYKLDELIQLNNDLTEELANT